MRKPRTSYNLIILFFSILLGFFASGLLRTKITTQVPFPIQSIQESKIELDRLRTETEDINKLILDKEDQYDKLSSLSSEEARELLLDELEKLQMTSGYKSVEGPGITIVMEDNNSEGAFGEDFDIDVIHDADVLRIINDLKVAGAEAISVNGQRILPTSEIKCGGPIIRVNGKSLATPFVIKAIGDPKVLNASVKAPNTYAYGLKHIDQIEIETKMEEKVVIDAYGGRFSYKYSRPLKEGE